MNKSINEAELVDPTADLATDPNVQEEHVLAQETSIPLETDLQDQGEPHLPDHQSPAVSPVEEHQASQGKDTPPAMDALKEQLLRLAADFDNYRKRSRKELAEARQQGMEMVFVNLLPVLDNLQLALIHSQDASASLKQGLLLVEKQFVELLQQAGIYAISAGVGELFDPKVHEAIGQTQQTTVSPGCIVQEVQRGYRQGEKLLRPSKVMVASEPSTST